MTIFLFPMKRFKNIIYQNGLIQCLDVASIVRVLFMMNSNIKKIKKMVNQLTLFGFLINQQTVLLLKNISIMEKSKAFICATNVVSEVLGIRCHLFTLRK